MLEKILKDGGDKLRDTGVAFAGVDADRASPIRAAREYFDALQLEFRLIDAVAASTETRLFGERLATPVMVTTLSGLDKFHPNGMAETARGAAAAGSVMWAGIGDEDELKAMIATGAKVVKIVKPYADHALILDKLEQAERHGAFATGMDISFFFARKNGVAPAPMSPKTLDEMRGFVKATRLPFVFKGVLSERDAAKALDAGAAGIVVSHHGGSVLDSAVPPLRVLPGIVKAIGGKIPVIVDCGITRGLDAFKALALGADAVCVGRAVMAGLTTAGADGVKEVLEGITWELARAMSMTGAKNPGDIDPGVLWTRYPSSEEGGAHV